MALSWVRLMSFNGRIVEFDPSSPYGCGRTRSPPVCIHASGWWAAGCVYSGSPRWRQGPSSSPRLAPRWVCSLPEALGHSTAGPGSAKQEETVEWAAELSLKTNMKYCWPGDTQRWTRFIAAVSVKLVKVFPMKRGRTIPECSRTNVLTPPLGANPSTLACWHLSYCSGLCKAVQHWSGYERVNTI